FAVVRAARHGGADTRRDAGVEEVDVEADVQVGVVVHAVQRFLHDALHADLVDVAHVVDVQAVLLDQLLLALVDRADADLPHHVGRDRRRVTAEVGQFARAQAAQARHRHAVDVARRGDLAGVEVGVGVQPQHAQLLAGLAAVARDTGDRAQAQAVVTAQQDRHAAAGELGVHRLHHQPVPLGHFVEVAVALDRTQPGVAWAFEVAAVQHVHAAGSQRLAQPRDTQRLRSQPCAAVAGTDVGGRANDRNGGMDAAHGSLLDLVPAVRVELTTYRLQGGCSTN